MAYLDNNGLSYFWGQIKSLFVKTAQGSANANKMVYTNSSGTVSTRTVADGYTVVSALPTQNISENTVYLIPTSIDPGGGGGGVTYELSISGRTITLTGSDQSTSSIDLPLYNRGVSS